MHWFGNVILFMSLMVMIAGAGMAFDRRERERIQERVTQELPERTALLSSPKAAREAQRRGYVTLEIGLVLLIIWFLLYRQIFV